MEGEMKIIIELEKSINKEEAEEKITEWNNEPWVKCAILDNNCKNCDNSGIICINEKAHEFIDCGYINTYKQKLQMWGEMLEALEKLCSDLHGFNQLQYKDIIDRAEALK
jgi:hypothetical protein